MTINFEDDYNAGIRIYRDHSNDDNSLKSVRHGRMVTDQDEDGVYQDKLEGSEAGWAPWLPIIDNENFMGAWSQCTPVKCVAPGVVAPIHDVTLNPSGEYFGKFVRAKAEDISQEPENECVSADGQVPDVGDVGLVVQTLNQSGISLIFYNQKKNDIEPLPLPTMCHGRQFFLEDEIPDSLRVLTSVNLLPGETFSQTNLFRTSHLLVAHKDPRTLLSPLGVGTGSIIAKSNQSLSGVQAENCTAPLNDFFMYVPNLVPGVIVDGGGGRTKVWVVDSDGVGEIVVSSECCDEEEEEQEPVEGEFPFILQYQDSLGVSQFLVLDDTENEFGPKYSSANMFGGFFGEQVNVAAVEAVEQLQPKNTFPRVDLIIDGTNLSMSISYGSLDDINEPIHNAAVIDQMQQNQDQGINAFGELQIGVRKIINREVVASDIPGSYVVFDGNGDPSPNRPGDPPNFSATLSNFRFL